MTNPFEFGTAVSGEAFDDRMTSFRKLYAKLAGGSANVVMYTPRRSGKASLVKTVLAKFADVSVPTVYCNINKISSDEK